jgi:hypothetical protein
MGLALLITVIPANAFGNSTSQSKPGLFQFVQAIQITPDANHLGGGFARINYVPATDRFVVTFGGPLAQPTSDCMDRGYSYKVYTTDMQETGESGTFACDPADSGSVMVDNTYYFAVMTRNAEQVGWHVLKIDAVNWTKSVDTLFYIDYPKEGEADPMVAYVDGQIDISSAYSPTGRPPDFNSTGYGTHHHFFSTDFQLIDEKILTDTPHINGSAMVYVDGVYYLVTANLYDGHVMVIMYGQDWNYLGAKTLIEQAHWSTGLVYDGSRFYLAYTDTRQRNTPGFFPVHLNIRLAAFDRDWNLVDDVAVTSFTPADNKQPGRPWVILHGNRLYVSYDLDTIDPATHEEQHQWQANVSVYELNPDFSPSQAQPAVTPSAQPGPSSGQAETCSEAEQSPLGVLRSTDHGATWTSLGNACLHGSNHILSADPTPLVVNGSIVLYFLDLKTLSNDPAITTPRIIYRAASVDGVNFDQPQPVYTEPRNIVDPFVLAMPDSSFRMYVPSDQEGGIISAVSSDGLVFTLEEGVRSRDGGMPGALLLPDGQVRMFLAGGNEGQDGIYSKISSDGLNFTTEPGVRIPAPANSITDNPEPIQLADGSYLMLYQIHDKKYEGLPPWEHTEIYLATSTDGFTWTTNPTIIGYGGTSCVVEGADGTLYLYYGH